MKENQKINYFDQCQQLLQLFESQLNGAREEVLARSNALSSSFEGLFDVVNELQLLGKSDQGISSEVISEKCISMNGSLVACISSLQFTDEVCQRIEHLSSGIKSMSKILDDENNGRYVAWDELMNGIRQSYSVSEEREIFDRVIHGVSSKLDEPSEDLF